MNKEKFIKIILSALGLLLILFVAMVAFYTGAKTGAFVILVPLCKFIVGYIFGWGASKIVLDKIWG